MATSPRSRTLTSEDKHTILTHALQLKMKELFGSAHVSCWKWKEQEAAKLAEEVYNALVPKPLQRQMAKLPDGVVAVSTTFQVTRALEGDEDSGDDRYYCFKLADACRIPYSVYSEHAILPATSPVFAKLRVLDKKAREHERTLRQVEVEVRQLLSTIRTVRQLLERWPEVTQIDGIPPAVLDDTPITAMVVMPTAVNNLLGLTK